MGEFTPLGINGLWIIDSPVPKDNRGFFREWFRMSELKNQIGREFRTEQANLSQSSRGVIRGIHYSIAPEGQAKLVTCVKGIIWDVVVDLRADSPTFKKWISIELKESEGKSVFIPEGCGHGFQSLQEDSVICYILSSSYNPLAERVINPLDEDLAINWPLSNIILSAKDKSGPGIDSLNSF